MARDRTRGDGHKLKHRCDLSIRKCLLFFNFFFFFKNCTQALGQVAHRSGGISILGDSRATWTWTWASRPRWPCLNGGVAGDDLHSSLPTPMILWFCVSVIQTQIFEKTKFPTESPCREVKPTSRVPLTPISRPSEKLTSSSQILTGGRGEKSSSSHHTYVLFQSSLIPFDQAHREQKQECVLAAWLSASANTAKSSRIKPGDNMAASKTAKKTHLLVHMDSKHFHLIGF